MALLSLFLVVPTLPCVAAAHTLGVAAQGVEHLGQAATGVGAGSQ